MTKHELMHRYHCRTCWDTWIRRMYKDGMISAYQVAAMFEHGPEKLMWQDDQEPDDIYRKIDTFRTATGGR